MYIFIVHVCLLPMLTVTVCVHVHLLMVIVLVQAFWCQFDGEGSGNKLDCVCVVDCENLTLYSDSGAVYHISVPFKVTTFLSVLICHANIPLNHTQVAAVTNTFDYFIYICVYLHIQHMLWQGDRAIECVV